MIMYARALDSSWGEGPTPFLPMEKCEFSHFFPWGKKYMEREGNEYFSLSFHILFFPFFPMGKNGKTHIFPWAKMGLDPPSSFKVSKLCLIDNHKRFCWLSVILTYSTS